MNYTNIIFNINLHSIRVTNMFSVEKLFLKGEIKMKKFFIVIIVTALQLNAQMSVDNSVGDVDKDFDHQLICKSKVESQEHANFY